MDNDNESRPIQINKMRHRHFRPRRYIPPEEHLPALVQYDNLRFENPSHISSILSVPDGKVATIAAAGASSIIALINGVKEVDAVDLSEEQIAYNYTLQYVIRNLGAKDFLQKLETFNTSKRSIKEKPDELRQKLLDTLPDFLKEMNVPKDLHEIIKHYILIEEFHLRGDLHTIKDWDNEINITKIIDAINEKRWRLHKDDVLHFLSNNPEAEYDAIYTSNVYDHLTQSNKSAIANATKNEQAFEFSLNRSLKPGGKVGIYNLYRQYDEEAAWKKRLLATEIWDSSWNTKKFPHILNGMGQGDWYELQKLEKKQEE